MAHATKPKPSTRRRVLPVDSPCWQPLANVYRWLTREYGDPDHAAYELLQALARDDDLGLGGRSERTVGDGKRTVESFERWAEWARRDLLPGEASISWRQRLMDSGALRRASSGLVRHVWEPDMDRLWSSPCEECDETEPVASPEPARVGKQGLDALRLQAEVDAVETIASHPKWTSRSWPKIKIKLPAALTSRGYRRALATARGRDQR